MRVRRALEPVGERHSGVRLPRPPQHPHEIRLNDDGLGIQFARPRAGDAETPPARAGQLGAFVNQVAAVQGHWLTGEHAEVLIRLAQGL